MPPAQSKKTNTMMWSPGGGSGSGSVNAGYDQPSHRQAHTGDASSHLQHVSAPRTAPGGHQFSMDTDYGGHGGQDRGPPWQARDGSGGTWSQSHHGPSAEASSQRHHQPPSPQQQQRGRMHGNQAHPAKTHVRSSKRMLNCRVACLIELLAILVGMMLLLGHKKRDVAQIIVG